MVKTGLWSLVLLAVIYLSFCTYAASGKCSGRWAIHACLGGNGKRSGAPSSSSSSSALDLVQPSRSDTSSLWERLRERMMANQRTPFTDEDSGDENTLDSAFDSRPSADRPGTERDQLQYIIDYLRNRIQRTA